MSLNETTFLSRRIKSFWCDFTSDRYSNSDCFLWCLLLAKALKPELVIQPQVGIVLWVAKANFHGETDLLLVVKNY